MDGSEEWEFSRQYDAHYGHSWHNDRRSLLHVLHRSSSRCGWWRRKSGWSIWMLAYVSISIILRICMNNCCLCRWMLLGNCHRTSTTYKFPLWSRPVECGGVCVCPSVPLLIRDAENEILNQLLWQIEPLRHLAGSFGSVHNHRIIFVRYEACRTKSSDVPPHRLMSPPPTQ